MKQYKRNYHTKGVLHYYQDGGYVPNNFFNRLFNRNGILEQQIRNEYGALKKIPLRRMHVDYARGDDASTLEQLHHNPEYIGPGEGIQFEQSGNISIPRGKMLVNDDPSNPRFVSVNYPGQYTTLINPVGLSKQNIKAIASNDFVSHALHGDPVYDKLNQQLGNMLVQKYGEQMVQNNGGSDAYIRGLISDDPEYKYYQDEMAFIPQAFKDGIVNYIKSGKAPSFQQGGQQNVPAPAFLLNPSLPPPAVTDPKAFARLYGIDSRPAGDLADSFHLPSRDLLEQRVQDSLTRKPVVPSAVAPKEQPKKKPVAPPPLPANNNPVNSDIATYYNVPTPEKFATNTQVAANEQNRLKHDLIRLGYNENQANYFASRGKGNMLPTVQQQLDDQAVTDYRVRNHPDYDPSKPVEDQQNLDNDNSLRARLLRGRNMLVDTGNPVGNLIAQTVTAPGKSFANLTVDPYKQYINPGFVTGLANLGNDLMTVFPSGMEQLKAGLTNRLVDTGVPESTLLLGKKLSDPVGAPAIRANLIDKVKDIGKDKLSELVYGEHTDDAWNEALNNESSMPPTNMYQLGGEQNVPAPAFLLNPSLPPQAVTDPKAFARLYGIDRPSGDIPAYYHLPSRDLLEQRAQDALAKKPAATNAAAAKEQQKKQPPPLPSNTNPTNSDIASYYNVPTPEKLDMHEQAVMAQQERLKHDLMRLGYDENQANYFTSKGKDNMLPTVQQQLDDQAVKDYRVRNHPDYDPSKPVEDQQNLDYDNSLRARLLRGRNMLVNTGNPVTDLIAQTITAPGKSFVNLTMDPYKQYIQPGILQGSVNLGTDLAAVFPETMNVGNHMERALFNRGLPQSSLMLERSFGSPYSKPFSGSFSETPENTNPSNYNSRQNLFRQRPSVEGTSAVVNKGLLDDSELEKLIAKDAGNLQGEDLKNYVENKLGEIKQKITPSQEQAYFPDTDPKGITNDEIKKAAFDYYGLTKDPRYLQRVRDLDRRLDMNGELERRLNLYHQQGEEAVAGKLPFNIKLNDNIKGLGMSLTSPEADLLADYAKQKRLSNISNYLEDKYFSPQQRQIFLSPDNIEGAGDNIEDAIYHESKHHWTNGLQDNVGNIRKYSNWLGSMKSRPYSVFGLPLDDFDYYKNPTEMDAYLMTDLRNDMVRKGILKDHFDMLTEKGLNSYINHSIENETPTSAFVDAYFSPDMGLIENRPAFISKFNKALPVVAGAAIGANELSKQKKFGGGFSRRGIVPAMPYMVLK